ncbi:MAG: nucleotidyltransferase family protein [Gammaproteobacteria bacterium]|nr:nucleotidyltransferase family protein [Gammaproteobacteria bacterium]NIR84925.1 nucleotidyltransferase family protein [Gammaproteobacteria bacterium]NIR91774.1 nucleotidyltransferase family protein [Gammaproteobacteria bacterium]NIU05972.1 nucleotidyltransferase family protein [Gammaproteobacteria bacterium]NIV53019.1 NTP transferase domain-containing protein [Gammaproteobacteria bacterium]
MKSRSDREPSRVAALVLAAGRSGRMGGANKLLVPVAGQPMLAHVVDAVQESRAVLTVVVVGYERERVAAVLRGRKVDVVANPDYARGLSASLACGVAALPSSCDAVIICLGDMPRIRAPHLDRLIEGFEDGCEICVPTHAGRRGNPVLWARRFFPELCDLRGDVGARALLERHAAQVCEVPMADDAVLFDVDSPEGLSGLPGGGPA